MRKFIPRKLIKIKSNDRILRKCILVAYPSKIYLLVYLCVNSSFQTEAITVI